MGIGVEEKIPYVVSKCGLVPRFIRSSNLCIRKMVNLKFEMTDRKYLRSGIHIPNSFLKSSHTFSGISLVAL